MNLYVKWFCEIPHQDRTKLNLVGKKVRAHEGAVTSNPSHDPEEEEVYQVRVDEETGNKIFPTGKLIVHLRSPEVLSSLLARHDLKLIYQNKQNTCTVHVAPSCWLDFGAAFYSLEAEADVVMVEKHGLVKASRSQDAG